MLACSDVKVGALLNVDFLEGEDANILVLIPLYKFDSTSSPPLDHKQLR